MKTTIISIILKLLFYRSPKITFSDEEINEYNKLFDEAINKDGLVRYTIGLFRNLKQEDKPYITENM